MKNARDAENECCQCGHVWRDHPAGYARHSLCPACGSVYWRWKNYDDEEDKRH